MLIAYMHVFVGNWFEDRFLEAEGTDIDPVLRPFSGPEEPLVGATKGVLKHHLVALCVATCENLPEMMSTNSWAHLSLPTQEFSTCGT